MANSLGPDFTPEFEAILIDFAESLRPRGGISSSQKYHLLIRVMGALKAVPDNKIARCVVGGSVGRDTCIPFLHNFNVFLFVNDTIGSFWNLLDKYKEALQAFMNEAFLGNEINLIHTQNSLQFIIQGLHFEIILVKNFVPLPPHAGELTITKLAELQRDGYLKFEQRSRNMTERLKYSLVESEVIFFQNQPPFVFNLIRICKFWKCTLYFKWPHPGLSSFIETVALHVAHQELKNNPNSPSLFKGFRAFLETISQHEDICITFDHECEALKKSRRDLPIVLNPVNKFVNLQLEGDTVKQLTSFASATLSALERMGAVNNKRTKLTALNFLTKVFEPRRQSVFKQLIARNLYSVKKCHMHLIWDITTKEVNPGRCNLSKRPREDLEAIERLTNRFVVTPAIIYMLHHTRRTVDAREFVRLARPKIFEHILGQKDDGSDAQFQLHSGDGLLMNQELPSFRLTYPLKMGNNPEVEEENIPGTLNGELPRIIALLTIRYDFDGERDVD